MTNRQVLMLEGSNGHAFFLKETLLTEGLAERVDLIRRAEQINEMMQPANPYGLIVINLVEAWEQGIQLAFCLSQRPVSCPVVLITPSDATPCLPDGIRFLALFAPFSLRDFSRSVRAALHVIGNNC